VVLTPPFHVGTAVHTGIAQRLFADVARVLRPGGVVVAWGYQDIDVGDALREPVDAFSARIRDAWPAERFLVDRAYADLAPHFAKPPFVPIDPLNDAPALPVREIAVEWPLMRLLDYFSSFSAVKRYREAHGVDPVGLHGWAIAAAWGDAPTRRLRWPLFARAARRAA